MPDAMQIRKWDQIIRSGGAVSLLPGTVESSYILAVIRRIHGDGPDPSDERGVEVYTRVEKALSGK